MLSKELKTLAKELNILYVEDEEDTRERVKETLEMFFGNVLVAENGRAGVEKFCLMPIDLVMTDLTMPVMDGIAMLREIRKIQPDIEVIVMTAHNTADSLLEDENIGRAGVLYKPMDIDKTLNLLYDICHRIVHSASPCSGG